MNLSELDFNNIGSWPAQIQGVAVALAMAVILFIGYMLVWSDQWEDLEQAQRQENQLKDEFERKQQKAANLDRLKAQLEEMKTIYAQMLRKLPSKTEMPDLLVDVSETALSSGIENELFRPRPETVKEFYAEKPIQLRMVGSYHEFGDFISGVASLPRIVILTMHDIALKPVDGQGSEKLRLEGTAKTYRYVEEGGLTVSEDQS